MHALVEEHLRVHKLVYGNEHWTPKWHATLHLAAQIERDGGIVLDTIVNERAHQTCKSFGDIMKNLDRFGEYVLTCMCEMLETQPIIGGEASSDHKKTCTQRLH